MHASLQNVQKFRVFRPKKKSQGKTFPLCSPCGSASQMSKCAFCGSGPWELHISPSPGNNATWRLWKSPDLMGGGHQILGGPVGWRPAVWTVEGFTWDRTKKMEVYRNFCQGAVGRTEKGETVHTILVSLCTHPEDHFEEVTSLPHTPFFSICNSKENYGILTICQTLCWPLRIQIRV